MKYTILHSIKIALSIVLAVFGMFQKELLLVSFDRTMAVTLGKKVFFWDVLLYLLIGLTVSMAVLSVGPLISFGFLLPPVKHPPYYVIKARCNPR